MVGVQTLRTAAQPQQHPSLTHKAKGDQFSCVINIVFISGMFISTAMHLLWVALLVCSVQFTSKGMTLQIE